VEVLRAAPVFALHTSVWRTRGAHQAVFPRAVCMSTGAPPMDLLLPTLCPSRDIASRVALRCAMVRACVLEHARRNREFVLSGRRHGRPAGSFHDYEAMALPVGGTSTIGWRLQMQGAGLHFEEISKCRSARVRMLVAGRRWCTDAYFSLRATLADCSITQSNKCERVSRASCAVAIEYVRAAITCNFKSRRRRIA
jgi:hypothetical protein